MSLRLPGSNRSVPSGPAMCTALVTSILGMLAPSLASASSLTLTTGITGAQTQIDINHTSWWTFTVPENDDLSAFYGYITMKRGPTTTASVYVNFYAGTPFGPDGYGYTNPTTPVFATSGAVGANNLTQSFVQYGTSPNPDLFSFAVTPVLTGLTGGTVYTVAIVSDAADTQSTAYFIKGGAAAATVVVNPNRVAPDPPPPLDANVNDVSLPGSFSLLGLGLLAALNARGKRTA